MENRVAEELSAQLQELGCGIALKRQISPGVPYPDLTWPNPLNLAVEVKSRSSITEKVKERRWSPHVYTDGAFFFVTLGLLAELVTAYTKSGRREDEKWQFAYAESLYSKTVHGWMDRLREAAPEGRRMLILHVPGTLISSSVCVLDHSAWDVLERLVIDDD